MLFDYTRYRLTDGMVGRKIKAEQMGYCLRVLILVDLTGRTYFSQSRGIGAHDHQVGFICMGDA